MNARFTIAAVAAVVVAAVAVQACLPPPYLYITFHAGTATNLVGAWTRDGCALTPPLSGGSLIQPRGLINRLSDGKLLLADAEKDVSRITVFASCADALAEAALDSANEKQKKHKKVGGANAVRAYQSDLIGETSNPGLDHPYGLAESPATGTLYATNQDTNVALAFNADSGSPLSAASYLNSSAQYAGEFAQFAQGSNGVRGVAVDGSGQVWIASEDDDGVYQFDAATGTPLQFVSLDKAVGVYYDNSTDTIFASSHDKKVGGEVVAISPSNAAISTTYTASGEGHPAGMVVYDGVLYVVGQDTGSLFAFSVSSGELLSTVVPSLGGTGEQIMLSEC